MIVNVVMGPYGSASTSAVDLSVIGDVQSRLNVDASGKLLWGSGALAGDVNLYRSAADTLKTDDRFVIGRTGSYYGLLIQNTAVDGGGLYVVSGSTAGQILEGQVNGEARDRIYIEAGGKIVWGDGTAVADTTLYRSAADTLKTDDNLIVGGGHVTLGAGGQIYTAGSTVYFRNVADSGYVSVDVQNAEIRGTANITGLLAVASAVRAGTFTTALRPTPAAAGLGGQVYDTTLSKPIWSDGTTWRDAMGTAV